MTEQQAMRLALEALEEIALPKNAKPIFGESITALRQALEQAEKQNKFRENWQEIFCPACGDLAKAHPQPAAYLLPDDMYDSKDWKAGTYADRVEWLHTMYEAKKQELDTYLEQQPADEPVTKLFGTLPVYDTRPQEFVCSTGLCHYKAKSDERLMKMPDEPVATSKQSLQVEQLLEDMLNTLPYNTPEYWMGRIREVLTFYTHPHPAAREPLTEEPVAWLTQAKCLVSASDFQRKDAELYGWKALYTRPQPAAWVGLNEREIELLDGMIEVQLDHARRCDSIGNRTMAEKQFAWDMERVALLTKLREKNGGNA